ncbi:MAG: thiamine biosynthesis protein ThiC, partial [Phycisphaerales bacterium JB060]
SAFPEANTWNSDLCAKCGHERFSVRISKEIHEFASGKAEGFDRGKPVKSDALTEEQQRILEQRGYLKPEEIHKLASKVKGKLPATDDGKAACHSDYVDDEDAKKIQEETLVQVDVRPALGIGKQDRVY